ncbi:type II secretion system secretin GspD [Marinomonas algicola]|uniref:type II secretion system secretin GspD n=1 Tax=Marinomonas algicola TaxID=2773454 RepID=UPI00174A8549|nr:type II secretion system secretin GspD [Marinomonas algicola]
MLQRAISKWVMFLVLTLATLSFASAKSWQVNLQQADIGVFVHQVAEMTGKSFIVDPRVKGKVTVISSAELNEEAIFRLFLSVLTVHGYAVIDSPEGYKVLPQNVAKQGGLDFDVSGNASGELLVTRVIAIKNAVAAELVPILRPLIPQYGHLASVNEVNALIVSDHADNIRQLENLISRLDSTVEGEISVVSLQYAWAGDILDVLQNISGLSSSVGSAPGRAVVSTRILADERTNRIVIKGKEGELAQIRDLIKQLDVPARKSSRLQVIPLRYADAKKTADLIKGVLGNTPTDGVSEKPTTFNIQADEDLNALLINAEPDVMADIQSVLVELDSPRAQVLVEAIIVEVKMEGSEALGFQWLFGDTSDGTTPLVGTNFTNAGNSLTSLATGIATGTPSLSNGITAGVASFNSKGDLNLAGILQAIESNTNANLLSTPKILTLDNQKSKIIVGETRPFQTGGYSDNGENPFVTINREDVGLTLEVTPHINAGDEVRMEVLQIVEAASKESSSLGTITTKREIQTTVIAGNRQTIVLGGLIEDNVTEVTQKVPGLGDIPYLGALFRSTSFENIKKNLLVFIRPTILRSKQDLDELSRSKYQTFKSIELTMPMNELRTKTVDGLFDSTRYVPELTPTVSSEAN